MMHEIFHRLRKMGNHNVETDKHEEFGILISGGGIYKSKEYPEFFTNKIEDFPQIMFSFPTSVANDISPLLKGTPVDNATKRKADSKGSSSPSTDSKPKAKSKSGSKGTSKHRNTRNL